jgi:hypothetical protein
MTSPVASRYLSGVPFTVPQPMLACMHVAWTLLSPVPSPTNSMTCFYQLGHTQRWPDEVSLLLPKLGRPRPRKSMSFVSRGRSLRRERLTSAAAMIRPDGRSTRTHLHTPSLKRTRQGTKVERETGPPAGRKVGTESATSTRSWLKSQRLRSHRVIRLSMFWSAWVTAFTFRSSTTKPNGCQANLDLSHRRNRTRRPQPNAHPTASRVDVE